MGEQTPAQPQPQAQSQPSNDSSSTTTQAQAHPQPQTENPNNDTSTVAVSAVPTVSSAVVASSPTELSKVPPLSSSPPSKIPLRPRKIRKLSPDPNSDPNASQQAATSSTPVVEPPKTVAKTHKPKLAQHRNPALAPRIIGRSLSCEGEVETAIRHLRNADPLLASLIDLHPPPTFDTFHTPFLALTRSILYQQLAFKAGTSIYTRFIALCGGENGVVPETVLSLTPQQLRQIGVSGRKASYLHDLARKYQNGILSDSAIVNMDDKSLFTMLTMVNGIGSWSVHMFMIFSLHRPDVLPINDLGVRKGVQLLYNLEDLPRPSQMDQLCEKWRPYRSVASWYLWRFVESKGAPSSAAAVAAGASLPPPPQEEQQQQQQHQQKQPQLLDPINSMFNLGIDLNDTPDYPAAAARESFGVISELQKSPDFRFIYVLWSDGHVPGDNDCHWKQKVWHLLQSIDQLEGRHFKGKCSCGIIVLKALNVIGLKSKILQIWSHKSAL